MCEPTTGGRASLRPPVHVLGGGRRSCKQAPSEPSDCCTCTDEPAGFRAGASAPILCAIWNSVAWFACGVRADVFGMSPCFGAERAQ